MAPLQPKSLPFPITPIVNTRKSKVLDIRASPNDGRPEGLIVLGVCLGVAVLLAFVWYTCGRAHVGPLKEIQMTKKGNKMRKEVRTVQVMQQVPSSYGGSSGTHRGGPYSTTAYTESSSSSDGTPEATNTSEPYTTPATVTSDTATEPDIREPPAAYVNPANYANHAMNYLDPTIGDAANGVADPYPRTTLHHAQGGLDSVATPLGRQATTSLPLPTYHTNGVYQGLNGIYQGLNGGVQGLSGATAYRPPTNTNARGRENHASNWWEA